jgi:tetratricopeptide (TPR) repeat protein
MPVVLAVLVVFGIYFGLPLKNEDQRQIEKSRALSFEKVSIPVMLREAVKELNEEDKLLLSQLESSVTNGEFPLEGSKSLSREWFTRGQWILAGHYAEKVAEIDTSAESWAIAGNTYSIGLQRYEEQNLAEFAKQRAIRNYEKAISVDPTEVEYRINLAVCYAEKPDMGNPMKGIMMLLDLEKKNPGHLGLQNTLAYYGIETGQLEKAQHRLKKVLEVDPENRRANCLMLRILDLTNSSEGKMGYEEKCNKN